jgi:hypothetical protein
MGVLGQDIKSVKMVYELGGNEAFFGWLIHDQTMDDSTP